MRYRLPVREALWGAADPVGALVCGSELSGFRFECDRPRLFGLWKNGDGVSGTPGRLRRKADECVTDCRCAKRFGVPPTPSALWCVVAV